MKNRFSCEPSKRDSIILDVTVTTDTKIKKRCQKQKKQTKKRSSKMNPDSVMIALDHAKTNLEIIYSSIVAVISAILGIWAHFRIGGKAKK